MAEHRFADLDPETRRFMIVELKLDQERGALAPDESLSERGRREYAELLAESFEHHDEQWLASALGSGERMDYTQKSAHQEGEATEEVPVTQALVVAEGEFGRFYARGLCRRAMAQGLEELEIYKLTDSVSPHFTYETLEVGNEPPADVTVAGRVGVRELLDILREQPGERLHTGLPGEPNSGLSVRLPREA